MRPLLLLLACAPMVALAATDGQPSEGAAPPEGAPAGAPAAVPASPPVPELPPPPPPAEAPAVAPLALPDAPPPPPPFTTPFPRFGVRLDLGFPDGAVLAVVVRPIPSFRVAAGPAWNYLGFGYQLGAGFAPFRWAITPVLSFDYGHFFDSDASRIFSGSTGVPTQIQPLLKKVGYDYIDGQLGLEFGSQRGFCFFLRGGLAYFWTSVRGASQAAQGNGGGTTTVTMSDPRLRATLPSVKLGVIAFF